MRNCEKRLFAALLASLIAVAIASPAIGGPLDDATAALEHGDYLVALRLLRPLADRSVAEAQHELGFMYFNGMGVPQDYVEAVKWYRLAADQGLADAQYDLGVMYTSGQGVPQSYVLAHMWLNLAAAQIPASRKEDRDNAVKARDLIAAKMTPEQIAEAQKLAREWKPKQAEAGILISPR